MDCSSGAPLPPLSVGINLAETPWGTPTWSQSERSMIPNEFRLRGFTWFRRPIQMTCFPWFSHGWHIPGAPCGGQVSDISNGERTTGHRLSMRFYRLFLFLAWCLLCNVFLIVRSTNWYELTKTDRDGWPRMLLALITVDVWLKFIDLHWFSVVFILAL